MQTEDQVLDQATAYLQDQGLSHWSPVSAKLNHDSGTNKWDIYCQVKKHIQYEHGKPPHITPEHERILKMKHSGEIEVFPIFLDDIQEWPEFEA